MSRIMTTRNIAEKLVKRGLVPDNCRCADIQIDPTGPLIIRYEVYVSAQHLGAVAEVLCEVAAEARAKEALV